MTKYVLVIYVSSYRNDRVLSNMYNMQYINEYAVYARHKMKNTVFALSLNPSTI